MLCRSKFNIPRLHHYGVEMRFRDFTSHIGAIKVSQEVQEAIRLNKPVVALESTIISHGMPYPRNVEVALQVENCVRQAGAIPATIAVIDGIPIVGLSKAEIMILANAPDSLGQVTKHVIKASRRDLAYACANKLNAATTVASTMVLANRAGIKVFATGGIGGVHRGAESSFDISADLYELGRTPVTVVCAGIKSILDIPKTLEVLETQGVPVLTFKAKDFPAFYTNDSGILSPMVAHDVSAIAKMIISSEAIGLENGMVVGCPNPCPADSALINQAIKEALTQANIDKISGQAVTPYLLSQVEQLTKGKSLDANVSLILNNAKIAADIASEYCRLKSAQPSSATSSSTTDQNSEHVVSFPTAKRFNRPEAKKVLVFGGAVLDAIGTATSALIMGSSNPGKMSHRFGGVGRNIADRLSSTLGSTTDVSLVSVVADDLGGQALLRHAGAAGINTSKVLVVSSQDRPQLVAGNNNSISSSGSSSDSSSSHNNSRSGNSSCEVLKGSTTATYTAIHSEDGDLCVGLADMAILSKLTPEYINSLAGDIRLSDLVVADANLTAESFASVTRIANSYGIPVFFEPTSDHKCLLPVTSKSLTKIDLIKPNLSELRIIMRACLDQGHVLHNKASVHRALSALEACAGNSPTSASAQGLSSQQQWDLVDVRILACSLAKLMSSSGAALPEAAHNITSEGRPRSVRGKHVLVSLGSGGLLWCGPAEVLGRDADTVVDEQLACRYLPVKPLKGIATNGAGDAFGAGFLAALLQSPPIGGGGNGPTLSCLQQGLAAAEEHLTTSASGGSARSTSSSGSDGAKGGLA